MKKAIITALLLVSLGGFTGSSTNFFANQLVKGDENIGFKFHIPTGTYSKPNPNGYSKEENRETLDYNNAWKLIFANSGEGYNTVSRFWIEDFWNKKHMSPAHNVHAAGYKHYFRTHRTLSKSKHTVLVAENNNPSTYGYNVTG